MTIAFLIQILVVLVIVGVILWVVRTYIPLPPMIVNLIMVVVVLMVLLWLLSAVGIFGGHSHSPVL